MSPVWIGCIVIAACALGGLAVWLTAGVFILLQRCIYPKRTLPLLTPAMSTAGWEEVRFPSAGDGAMLSGWFVPANSRDVHGVVLCCHGMSQNREQMLAWGESLWARGFHVLLFDFRAVGHSEGHRTTGGVLETQDIRGAVNYVTSRPDCVALKLGALGFSMGGSSAIMAAAEDQRIRAVATHAAYATIDSAIAARCRYHFGPFGPIVDWGFKCAGRSHFHTQPAEILPIRAVDRLAPRPILILHGEKDPIVPPHNAHELYEAAGEPKSIYLIEAGDHEPEHAHTEEVHSHVADFFRRNLAEHSSGIVSSAPRSQVHA